MIIFFFDSFTEGDTVALRESLAQLSGASSPAESVVSTSSNPSATSSIRGGRREKSRRGKKKGHSGSSCIITCHWRVSATTAIIAKAEKNYQKNV